MKRFRKIILRYLVASADSLELSRIVQMVIHRYAKLFGDEEVVFLSLPKNDKEERQRIIRAVLEIGSSVEKPSEMDEAGNTVCCRGSGKK